MHRFCVEVSETFSKRKSLAKMYLYRFVQKVFRHLD